MNGEPLPDAENVDEILEWAGYGDESLSWEYAQEFAVESVLMERYSETDDLDEIQEAYLRAAFSLEEAYQEYDGDDEEIKMKALSVYDTIGEAACTYYFEDDIKDILDAAFPSMSDQTPR